MRTRSLLAVLVLAAALTGCAGGPPRGQSAAEPADAGTAVSTLVSVYPPAERTVVTTVKGELLDGSDLDTAALAGMVVVVNFWASWCAPCRAEAGELNTAATATRALGVRFVGVNVRDGRDAARSFVHGREVYPSLYDPTGRVVLGFTNVSPNTIPATVILDRDSRVAVVLRKAVTERELSPLIRQIAAENVGG